MEFVDNLESMIGKTVRAAIRSSCTEHLLIAFSDGSAAIFTGVLVWNDESMIEFCEYPSLDFFDTDLLFSHGVVDQAYVDLKAKEEADRNAERESRALEQERKEFLRLKQKFEGN